jgi:hypothetical protein
MRALTWKKLQAWIAECGAIYCTYDPSDVRLLALNRIAATASRPVSTSTADRGIAWRDPSQRL